MDVTDVLRDRMAEPRGLQRMVAVSVAAHVLAVAFILLAPGAWVGRDTEPPPPLMTISLGGGGEGPQNGGMTTMGGRPVQVERPVEEAPKREAIRPPAPSEPDMTLPIRGAKPTKATPALNVAQAPDESRGRTPTKGPQTRAGNAVADTGVRGQGFGLSTGGGPGSGSSLDVADFCCPDYLVLMIERIRSAWTQDQGAAGQVLVKFTVQRDGRLADPAVERSSDSSTLDLAALRAVAMTKTLPPLPGAFPNPTLTVHLNFQYK
jgi:TonB family protein